MVLLAFGMPLSLGAQAPPAQGPVQPPGQPATRPKPLKPFEPLKLMTVPGEPIAGLQLVKPGHWTVLRLEAKANLADFSGRLVTELNDARGEPVRLGSTQYSISCSRAASLIRGQPKQLDTWFLVPTGKATSLPQFRFSGLADGEVLRESGGTSHLARYTYLWVVLTPHTADYQFLSKLDTVALPVPTPYSTESLDFFRVVIPQAKTGPLLPSDPLGWTSIAVLLWDDWEPQLLRAEEQTALLDWLHWGGHLLISGPESLDRLRGSFLQPYLPATSEQTLPLSADALAPLAEGWWADQTRGTEFPQVPAPWPGVDLQLTERGEGVPDTGDLVATCRVGRGRVTVTAFRLRQRELLKWPSFDSWLHCCLLRRPAREFKVSEDLHQLYMNWADEKLQLYDPTLTSQVRLLSRDGYHWNDKGREEFIDKLKPLSDEAASSDSDAQAADDIMVQAFGAHSCCGWSDDSLLTQAAQDSLRVASGITIPPATFVLRSILWYLAIVVGANWCLFKALGRVEWAWSMVPVLSVVTAGLVIWLAQLDIGFARSQTDLSVVEMFGDSPRAHVTGYHALYTSLSTSFTVEGEVGTKVLPMSRGQFLWKGTPTPIAFQYDSPPKLQGFPVDSNSVDLLHSERIQTLGQGLSLENLTDSEPLLNNRTGLVLRHLVLLARPGVLEPSAKLRVWRAEVVGERDQVRLKRCAGDEYTKPVPVAQGQRLSTQELREALWERETLEPGEVRLVADFDEPLPGLTIEPRASQQRHRGVLVAHLRYGSGARLEHEHQLRPAVQKVEASNEEL